MGLSIFPAPMTREDMDIDWKIFVRLNMHPFTHIFSFFFLTKCGAFICCLGSFVTIRRLKIKKGQIVFFFILGEPNALCTVSMRKTLKQKHFCCVSQKNDREEKKID